MAFISSTSPRLGLQRKIPAPKRGPSARLAQPSLRVAKGLRFTDLLLLSILGLAFMFTLSTPLFGTKLQVSAVSHLPFILLCPVLALHLIGGLMNRDDTTWAHVLGATWPLILLGLFALVGSAVAKWELRISDTYISFAVYLLLFPFYTAAVPANGPRLRSWVRAVLIIWIMLALAALVGEIARFSSSETIHEVEYVVISGFVAAYYLASSARMRLLALACIVLAGFFNHKLTGYIIALVAVMYIMVGAGWRGLRPRWRSAYTTVAVLGVVLMISTLALLYFEFRQFLPSGNTEVRLAQYQVAWARFLQSPIWGSAYADGSGELYTEYLRRLNIPTHSDVLDLLKHGGLIGLGLFAWGYLKVYRLVGKALAACKGNQLFTAYFTAIRFFALTALFTFAINPLLLRGPYLIVIWGMLGLACGTALAVLKQHSEERP